MTRASGSPPKGKQRQGDNNAAERNVIAHLLKLESEGAAVREGALWRRA